MSRIIEADVRRIIIDELLLIGHVTGNLKHKAFVERIYPESKTLPVVSDKRFKTLSEEIWQHMDLNNDFTEADLFYIYIGVENLTDDQFLKLLKEYVNPTITREYFDEENEEWVDLQDQCVESINRNLACSGYSLVVDKTIGERKVYEIVSNAPGVDEDIKNIIFATTDKPEIIFTDALANIITVRNEDKCLIYNKPILNEALTWRQMVKWFEEKYGITANAEKIYIDRLRESFGIASPPEITFFDTYLEWMHEMGDDVPALIPQVYLYYDPLTKNEREWKKIFEHQIFDFFMLFSLRGRVIIEIDGKQHYGKQTNVSGYRYPIYEADPDKYAQMVRAQRDLSLYGYDVYRFGGKEFSDNVSIKNDIKDFFDRLIKKYKIYVD